ncbi:MAG TPA: hypothetical protein VK025_07755 [Steroidobacter sp.]|jgi:hypothetical protein|nr:hypothetical protein [Steroidobacteraceae bacterium]HLS81283.1 hypothetical protein [Steroidobacter sp.]
MLRFLQTFLEIALWRKGPQDLPASRTLAILVLAAYMAAGFVAVKMFDLRASTAVMFIIVDVLMIGLWLWAVLAFFGRRQRFTQTITATLGVGVLITLLDMMMRAVQLALGLDDALASNWLLVRFVIIALVMGRIFMHALDRGLVTGMALTVAIVYSTDAVARLVLDRL